MGVQWNIANDSFQYNVNILAREVTKRGILSFISSIYDPLAIVSPFILTAKIILQNLCREKLVWEEEISCTAVSRWNNWIKELPKLAKLNVPRYFKPENFGQIKTVELHYFSDASESGFGAVLYVKSGKKQLKKRSSLLNLDPVVINGMLCIEGRLKHLEIETSSMKHPMILPKQNLVVDLIIRYYHQLSSHLGKEYVLSLIRERFWIINAHASVHQIISHCFRCKKYLQQPMHQKMADLPRRRITPGKPPFTYVGVDYFGLFYVKRARSMVKRYGVIFTCLVVCAIHVEVANSLDTDFFINPLRRFMAYRDRPKEIRSDNGTHFTCAENELKHFIRQWNQEKIHESLLQHEVKWHFNPQSASHMGGV